ncbi:hypothetical protein ACFXAE_06760 [Streptomyces sp. NPDC059454]|uniref:hypothetical protein n=1 Tax=Streptomyces sp. NPDC059454 TaxID=3346836 RepID=UPI0036A93009
MLTPSTLPPDRRAACAPSTASPGRRLEPHRPTRICVCSLRGVSSLAWVNITGLPAFEAPTSFTLRPVVAGPHNMPVITDPEEARADLVLTSLAAITHAAEPAVNAIPKALSTALRDVPEDIADPIVEFTAQGLGKHPAKHLWRNLVAVDLSFYKSYLVEEIREEARAEARAEALAEALVKSRVEDILLILEQRGLDISDDVRSRIADCTDPDLLRRRLTRAVTAPKAEEIFEGE